MSETRGHDHVLSDPLRGPSAVYRFCQVGGCEYGEIES